MKTRKLLFVCLAFVWLAFLAGPSFAGNFYQGVSPTSVFWPGGVVPYQFATNITASEQQTYLDGVREWELAANIHFVPYTNQTNWILFQYAPGTFVDQYVPYTTPETVTVSVLSRAQVCHEMGHALGFTHENIRVDKNTYITVLTNNVYPASNIVWFTIDPNSVTNGPYDYESVMHLANNFSSISPTDLYTQLANPPYQSFQPFMGNLALSAGDRAAAAYLYGPPTVPVTNIVTTTADVGLGSLRAALYYGIDHPGATIRFNIPTNDPGYSHGVFTIYLTGFLPPLVNNGTVIDGSTQPGFTNKPLIVIDGSQIISAAYTPGTVTGLYIYAANCQLKNLSFQNFNWNGLTLSYPGATNNTIAGCWCGVDYSGTNPVPNALQGILIYNGASYNTIGGTNALARNLLSGNSQYGVFIGGTNTTGNIVCGNYIGTDPTGTIAVPNVFSGVGVLNAACSNVIGGALPGQGNLLSGNSQYGVFIGTPGTTGNIVYGNYIGTSASGTVALANSVGGAILTAGANSNIFGGPLAAERNIVSGNFNFGLWVDSSNNVVQGNWIGLNASGTAALPNTLLGMEVVGGAQNNSILGNVFSGNYSEGLRLSDAGTSGNLVQGNFMGTDPTGTYAIPNPYAGLTFFNGAVSNIAGGTTPAARNIISGAYSYGVVISEPGTSANVVEGNYIGLNASGASALANFTGVIISDGAESNTLGGVAAGAGNVISGNYYPGVNITDPGTSGNKIEGNYIGTGPNGSNALANGAQGIFITNGAQDNVIGLNLSGSGAANRIAFNGRQGIGVYAASTIGNTIRGNNIFSNFNLGINLAGGTENSYGVTANHVGGAIAGPNDFQNYPVITNVFTSGPATIIAGTLNSSASRSFWIDGYRNIAPDPSGYGQGQIYAGGVTITTDVNGNAIFLLSTSGGFAGQYFSVTATDQTTGDTSEFSMDVIATNGPVPPSFVGPFSLTSAGFAANISLTTGQSYHVQTATNLAANPIAWVNLTNFVAGATNYSFLDRSATNFHARFYRVTSP
jgi:hypothetical protein